MTVRDLTPEQRRELLAAWDAAVRAWWSGRDIATWTYALAYGRLYRACPTPHFLLSPESVAHGC